MKNQDKGFSLIELLIVVAIILIISAIAIPNLLRSKMAANESSAISSLRTLNTGEITYAAIYPNSGFSPDMLSLGGSSAFCTSGAANTTAACIVDDVLAKAITPTTAKSGYYFTYGATATSGTVATAYTIAAAPVNAGSTGQRYFFTDQSGIIRYGLTSVATATSSPIQ